jgi:hypothetical protein
MLTSNHFRLMFRKEHIQVPDNVGEKRESLVILEKVGMQEGLLKSLVTEADNGIIGDERDIRRR